MRDSRYCTEFYGRLTTPATRTEIKACNKIASYVLQASDALFRLATCIAKHTIIYNRRFAKDENQIVRSFELDLMLIALLLYATRGRLYAFFCGIKVTTQVTLAFISSYRVSI